MVYNLLNNERITSTHENMTTKVSVGDVIYNHEDKREAEIGKFGGDMNFNIPHVCVSATEEGEVLFFVPEEDLEAQE